MFRLRTPALALMLVALATGAPLDSQEQVAAPEPTAPGAEVPAVEAADPAAEEVPWLARLVANTELGFTPRSSDMARTHLATGSLSDAERAVALVALGCSGAWQERSLIESFAVEGELELRTAALLALGELGSSDRSVMVPLIEDPEARVGECALLALLRTRDAANRALVQAVADDPEHPLAAAAADLIVFATDPTVSTPTRAASQLLQLRLLAARRYGLVRGQAWKVLLLGELGENEAFLDRLVYLAASELHAPAVRDHFLEIVLSGPPPGDDGNLDSLRGAVNAIPAELSLLVDSGLWAPKGGPAWNALLAEIDAENLEGLTDSILRMAWVAIPGLRSHASLLITRGGSPEGLPTLEMELETRQVPAQVRILETLGGSGISLYVKVFSDYLEHRSPQVATAALVGQVRLGFDEAQTRLRRYFKDQRTRATEAAERGEYDDEDPDGDLLILDRYGQALISSMCRTARDPVVRELLLEVFPRLDGAERIEVATALAAIGRPETRAILLQHIRENPPAGPEGVEHVRALARSLSLEELTHLREVFPVEDDFEVNAALALALTRSRDTSVLPLLRSALWREPMHRSLLAAGLIVDVAGIDALREELQHPSLDTSVRDLRRVGFALGEFGGLGQVEILSKRLGSGDPALQGALLGALAARTY